MLSTRKPHREYPTEQYQSCAQPSVLSLDKAVNQSINNIQALLNDHLLELNGLLGELLGDLIGLAHLLGDLAGVLGNLHPVWLENDVAETNGVWLKRDGVGTSFIGDLVLEG